MRALLAARLHAKLAPPFDVQKTRQRDSKSSRGSAKRKSCSAWSGKSAEFLK
jgi:hypothetical protein